MKPPKPSEIVKFYGNPDTNGDGQPDPKWEAANLIYIVPPYRMQWSWGGECKRIRVHKKCADSLLRCLTKIGQEFDVKARTYYQLDRCGGGYTFRPIRGVSDRLSMHAYGAAIDLAPELNPLGHKWYPNGYRMMPEEVVKIFADEGWYFGGLFRRPDCQHMEYVDRTT